MTDNPDYGTILYDLLTKADYGDAARLDAYLAADPTRAASADRRYVLAVRQQFGTFREGRCTATRRNPIATPGPVRQRGRLSSYCGAMPAARGRGTN